MMKNRLFSSSAKTRKQQQEWSGVLRNDTILVEAYLGAVVDTEVEEASRLFLQKPPTAGWEYGMLGKRKVQAEAATAASGNIGQWLFANNHANSNGVLKGMKFHVYEHFEEEEEDDQRDDDSEAWMDHNTAPAEQRPVQRRYKNEGLTIWTFACVYDPALVKFIQAKSFLEKVITITEIFRQPTVPIIEGEASKQEEDDDDPWVEPQVTNISGNNPFDNNDDDLDELQHTSSTQNRSPQDVWRYGSHHAAQYFAPELLQWMDEVSYLGKLAMRHEQVDALKEIISRNIEVLLEKEARLTVSVLEKAVLLNEMAQVFAKQAKKVKRKILWNNAMYGAVLGTAITAGVAACVVPPLVLLL